MSKKKFTGSVGSKGYYIALVLCAAAIGISGFLYYRNVDKDPQAEGQETLNSPQPDQEVVATHPNDSLELPTGPQGENPSKTPRQTMFPVEGQTVAVYAMNTLSYNPTTRDWRVHNGIDIAAEEGTKVYAAADGEVYTVYEDDAMGMTVVIRHDEGYTTKYSSLAEETLVAAGDKVTVGQAIGTVGNTALMESAIGDHVHFSVSCNGEMIDPSDFLQQE